MSNRAKSSFAEPLASGTFQMRHKIPNFRNVGGWAQRQARRKIEPSHRSKRVLQRVRPSPHYHTNSGLTYRLPRRRTISSFAHTVSSSTHLYRPEESLPHTPTMAPTKQTMRKSTGGKAPRTSTGGSGSPKKKPAAAKTAKRRSSTGTVRRECSSQCDLKAID